MTCPHHHRSLFSVGVSRRRAFRLLCLFRGASALGSGLTRFATLLWACREHGTASAVALLGVALTAAYVCTSPWAGVWVDRWDRRRILLASTLGALLTAAGLWALYAQGTLALGHILLSEALAGGLEALQVPATTAATTLLLPRQDYTRANGQLLTSKSVGLLIAPAVAAWLLQWVGLGAVLVAGAAVALLALLALLPLCLPSTPRSQTSLHQSEGLRRQMAWGLRYIAREPGLRSLLVSFFLVNLFGTIGYYAILPPLVLTRTAGNEAALATVRTAMGFGGVAGGALVSLWAGPRRKVRAYLISTALSFLVCDTLTALSRGPAGWATAGFLGEMSIPFLASPYLATWQELVPADVQGRVLSARDMVKASAQPIGYLAGGWLADRVLGPALSDGGLLVQSAGRLVGSGPGAGMAAVFLCTATLGGLTGLLGLRSRTLRQLDLPAG